MWPFDPKQVRCPAGEWTTLIDNAFVQMPREWEIAFEAEDGVPIEGEYEVSKTAWIFPTKPERGQLQPRMAFERGWFNTFYKLRVRPTRAVAVTIR
jgi:hypothetical protein